ncbi:MAG TPA: hypothetical protein VJQ86_08800 [Rhodanobacteraceae bacterium]|nr:hypothetical protein [Rhodanobacteraceae bacterium]
MRHVPSWLRTVIALPIGIVAINVFHQLAALLLPALYGGNLEYDSHRFQMLLLGMGAGVAGSFTMGAIARQRLWLNMGIFLVAMLAIDVFAITSLLATQPAWFKAAVLLSLPLQVWAGALLAKATFRQLPAAAN